MSEVIDLIAQDQGSGIGPLISVDLRNDVESHELFASYAAPHVARPATSGCAAPSLSLHQAGQSVGHGRDFALVG